MATTPPSGSPRHAAFRWAGPGLIMAASGIGASDIISATVGGATYGLTLLWALVIGAFIKFVLSEGLARWQLATGTTLLEGWARHLPRWVLVVFSGYLVLWAIAVSGALTSGCGLAIENVTGGAVPRSWGALAHGTVAFVFIYTTRTNRFMQVMKPLIVVMFFSIVICAALVFPDPHAVLKGLFVPTIPTRGETYVLSLIGGIGGSLTLLSYGYLLRDEENAETRSLSGVRRDLATAYTFTAVFGLAVMIIANRVFYTAGVTITDQDAVSRMAGQLAALTGATGFYIYSVGFWAAVVASLFGVWQSIPSLAADCWSLLRQLPRGSCGGVSAETRRQRAALIFMALASVPFAFGARPLAVIIGFTVLGSLFIPFLAATLLYLNNRVAFPGNVPRNRLVTNIVLVCVLVLFAGIGCRDIALLIR